MKEVVRIAIYIILCIFLVIAIFLGALSYSPHGKELDISLSKWYEKIEQNGHDYTYTFVNREYIDSVTVRDGKVVNGTTDRLNPKDIEFKSMEAWYKMCKHTIIYQPNYVLEFDNNSLLKKCYYIPGNCGYDCAIGLDRKELFWD